MKHKYPAAAIFPHAPTGVCEILGHLPLKQIQNKVLYQKDQVHHTKAPVHCKHKTEHFLSHLRLQSRDINKPKMQAVCLCFTTTDNTSLIDFCYIGQDSLIRIITALSGGQQATCDGLFHIHMYSKIFFHSNPESLPLHHLQMAE